MAFTRSALRKSLVLPRSTYTNFGEPNYEYAFTTNGSMSVSLKAISSYQVGDTLKFIHRNGGVAFNITSLGSNDIYNGSSSTNSITCSATTPIQFTVGNYIGTTSFIVSEKQ